MQDIRIGVTIADVGGSRLDALLADFTAAETSGFQSVWVPNIFGMDALTLSALAGQVSSRIEIGTAVVQTHSRHPLYMAQQALTTQAALGGRFVLGLGPSHRIVIENVLGLDYAKPARHVREYLEVLAPLLRGDKVDFRGETYRVNGGLRIESGGAPPVVIGALGPLMRRVAGTLADGTITWMAGSRALGEEIVPDLQRIARAAGRPSPRVIAGLPVALTSDVEGARAKASKAFALYGSLPSYRAMLELEGIAQPGDLAVVGDETAIETAIRRFATAGATDFQATIFPFGPDPRASVQRTRELLAELARRT